MGRGRSLVLDAKVSLTGGVRHALNSDLGSSRRILDQVSVLVDREEAFHHLRGYHCKIIGRRDARVLMWMVDRPGVGIVGSYVGWLVYWLVDCLILFHWLMID